MKAAEQSIPWHFRRAVVAIEKSMVQLMKKVAELQLPPADYFYLLKTAVGGGPANGMQHRGVNHMDRMRGNNEKDQRIQIQRNVLNRMHGMTRPGSLLEDF